MHTLPLVDVVWQITLLTFALLETWAVYMVASYLSRPALAHSIDSAVRCTFPLIYILATLCLVLVPFSKATALAVAVASVVITVWTSCQVSHGKRILKRRRTKCCTSALIVTSAPRLIRLSSL